MVFSRLTRALIAMALALVSGCATGTATGPDASAVDGSPLHVAAIAGRQDAVQGLLDRGAAADTRASRILGGSLVQGITPLHLAAFSGHEGVGRTLLEHGAQPNARASNGLTPLHLAAMADRPELVRLLVSRGADLGARDQDHGATPLHRAARDGGAAAVDALLAAGADVEAKDRYGLTPMRQATSAGRAAVVARLLTHGVDPTRADAEGFTALHAAADRGRAAVVEVLLGQGPSVRALLDVRVHDGRTPLHLAAQAPFPNAGLGEPVPDYLRVVELLLAAGADLSARDRVGQTPLHAAVDQGNRQIAELLLTRGADPGATTHDGRTPVDYARRRNDPAMLELLERVPARSEPARPGLAGSVWEQHMEAGNLAYAAGRHDDAGAAWRLALDAARGFEPDDPRRFPPLRGLGWLAFAKRRYAEAESLLRQALDLRQKLLGPEDRSVAESLGELAAALRAQGRYAEAEHLVLQATAIREKALWPAHPETLKGLADLAELYREQARYSEAERLQRRVLATRETRLDREHLDVARSLNDLAVVLLEQARYAEAEPLLRRAIAIRERALGRQHPDVASSLRNLAMLYQFQRRDAEAEPLFREALAIDEAALGPDHSAVGTTLNNLAMLELGRGRYAEAEPLLRRAAAIREKALGSDHPLVAQSLNNLAVVYQHQGRDAEAERLLQRALEIRERTVGPRHPEVAQILVNLGVLYLGEGRHSEAEALLTRALTIQERTLEPDHPTLATTLGNLAGVHRAQGRHEEAETLQRRALTIREARLGAEHPDVVGSLYALAETTLAQGRSGEAEALFRRAGDALEARGETLAVVTLTALSHDHVDRPDPQRLAEVALDEVRRRLSLLGVQDRLAEPAGTEAEVTAELRRGVARAVELARGRASAHDIERAAAEGMVTSLRDRHTRLLSLAEARTLALLKTGRLSYVGIGVVSAMRKGQHYVWHVRPDSPADRAGLKAFDRVLAVDGDAVEGLPGDQLGRRIRGPAGTTVTLTVQRPGESQPRLVPVVLGLVSIWPVEHRIVPPGIGYVRLTDITGGAGQAIRRALEDLQPQALRGLIVDVRNNWGGLLVEVDQAAELLLPRGSTVRESQTRYGRSVVVTRDEPLLPLSLPLVVLVDEHTRSAVEVFAAAVQSSGRGVVVGTRTAGEVGEKSQVWLPDGSGLLVRKARTVSPARRLSGRERRRPGRRSGADARRSRARG